ncbi:MAG: PIN domain nuclease [Clostridiales bacterium]|nr:PIN domain nuclease [Clostridiales bacterium]
MIIKAFRFLLTLLGIGLGLGVATAVSPFLATNLYENATDTTLFWLNISWHVILGLSFGIILFILAPAIIKAVRAFLRYIENRLTKMPMSDLFICVIGLIIGLVIAYLLSRLISSIPSSILQLPINLLSYIVFSYLGLSIMYRRRNYFIVPAWFRKRDREIHEHSDNVCSGKLLDTSAIIDGRIYDLSKTGFLEGALLVPSFVLDELRHIADNADTMKRNRGRRGLDMLKQMQTDSKIPINIVTQDYEELTEVDAKLLRLATEMDATIITTDYNLNKVAAVQRVPVLNVNDLANAIKSVLIPGEMLTATVVKEGKELGQGLAYLPDGTMIVIENGKQYVGMEMPLMVTSVMQTSAGRLIFAKIADAV